MQRDKKRYFTSGRSRLVSGRLLGGTCVWIDAGKKDSVVEGPELYRLRMARESPGARLVRHVFKSQWLFVRDRTRTSRGYSICPTP